MSAGCWVTLELCGSTPMENRRAALVLLGGDQVPISYSDLAVFSSIAEPLEIELFDFVKDFSPIDAPFGFKVTTHL